MKSQPLTWDCEQNTFPDAKIVCGTDEAGRGPLAGRVYAAAVVLDYSTRADETILSLNDSKKLTEKKRFELEPKIKEIAKSWCVAYSEVSEIEETDILSASLHAMRRAIDGLGLDRDINDELKQNMGIESLGGEKLQPDAVLVDGNMTRGFAIKAKAIVGGDGISPSIAASSILAKTARDNYCINVLAKKYPAYGFDVHKGYGTKKHYEAVDKYGLCEEHRQSFFKKYFAAKENENK